MNNWQSQREKLNHDILCNQLRNELGTLRRDPRGNSLHRLELWPEHAKEYRQLFDSAAEALSTIRLLELPEFDCWTNEKKNCFKPVFHKIFLINSGIELKVERLNEMLNEVLTIIKKFLETPVDKRTEEMVLEMQEILDHFSAKISELPAPFL